MSKKPLVILGAGGFAKEAYQWFLESKLSSDYRLSSFFRDNATSSKEFQGFPVISNLIGYEEEAFLVAVGSPALKKKLWEKATDADLVPLSTVTHPSLVCNGAYFASGGIFCPGVILTRDIAIGRCVILNLHVTVGHDCQIGDFVTVSPGANISGNVHIGEGAYIGTGACIREGVKIGKWATVGMGAVVVKDVPPYETVVGNPARQMVKK